VGAFKDALHKLSRRRHLRIRVVCALPPIPNRKRPLDTSIMLSALDFHLRASLLMKKLLPCFLLLPLLAACKPKEEFLRGTYDFELDSGNYYLVATEGFIGQRTGGYTRGPNIGWGKAADFSPEGSRFLFDDPEVLKRFRKKLVTHRGSIGDSGYQLVLRQKDMPKYSVKVTPDTTLGVVPKEMLALGIQIAGRKQVTGVIEHLLETAKFEAIEGVHTAFSASFKSARVCGRDDSDRPIKMTQENVYEMKCDQGQGLTVVRHDGMARLPQNAGKTGENDTVSVLFPLLLFRHQGGKDDRWAAYQLRRQKLDAMLHHIKNKLMQEMQQRQINHYHVVMAYNYSNVLRDGMYLPESIPLNYEIYGDIKIRGYGEYVIGMRISCATGCAEKLREMQTADWVESEVDYEEFLAAARQRAAEKGVANLDADTLISGRRYHFNVPFKFDEGHPYVNDSFVHEGDYGYNKIVSHWYKGLMVSGTGKNLVQPYTLIWYYDLERALTTPPPVELKALANPQEGAVQQ